MAHWTIAIQRLQQLKVDLPTLVGNEMVNFALDNIRAQRDINGQTFTPRKPGTPRDSGRAILVDTGRGRRSVRSRSKGDNVELLAEDYMVAHNEGVDRTVSVRGRTGRRFSRKMKLPKRQFSGDSGKQRQRINEMVARRIVKALQ